MFPTPFPWYRLPQIELVRFKAIDFFPPKPERIGDLRSICIASKNRTIGDALILSALPRLLKQRYPELKVLTYPRGFNPVVFWNNPYVDGITYLPHAIFGDDTNEGSGHLMTLKENFFGVEAREKPRPELYLTASETRWAETFIRQNTQPERQALPLLVIHPFGHTVSKILTPEIWAGFVREQRSGFRIAQVGVEGQQAIPGCDFHFLAPRKRAAARKLFALIRRADRFIGIDSGPMHIARAFSIPSLILSDREPPEEIFKKRRESPYFLNDNWVGAFLYEDEEHLYVPALDARGISRAMAGFCNATLKPAGSSGIAGS